MEKVFSPKLFGLIKDGSVKKNLSKDILAGIVVGIVALPLAIAFAVSSGVSPEKGIITAIVAGFLISFFGGSRVQIPSLAWELSRAMGVTQKKSFQKRSYTLCPSFKFAAQVCLDSDMSLSASQVMLIKIRMGA